MPLSFLEETNKCFVLWGGQSWPQPAFSRLSWFGETLADHSAFCRSVSRNISALECLASEKLSDICHSCLRHDSTYNSLAQEKLTTHSSPPSPGSTAAPLPGVFPFLALT